MTNTLPAEVGLLAALPSQGSYFLTNSAVVCDLGALAAGASARVQFTVRALQTGQFVFAANVGANVPDLTPENNQQTLNLDVVGPPALRMSIIPLGGPTTLF